MATKRRRNKNDECVCMRVSKKLLKGAEGAEGAGYAPVEYNLASGVICEAKNKGDDELGRLGEDSEHNGRRDCTVLLSSDNQNPKEKLVLEALLRYFKAIVYCSSVPKQNLSMTFVDFEKMELIFKSIIVNLMVLYPKHPLWLIREPMGCAKRYIEKPTERDERIGNRRAVVPHLETIWGMITEKYYEKEDFRKIIDYIVKEFADF